MNLKMCEITTYLKSINKIDNFNNIVTINDYKTTGGIKYDEEKLRLDVFNYIIAKINNRDLTTEKNNNYQIMKATNAIYLDADFKFRQDNNLEISEYIDVTKEMSLDYLSAWEKYLDKIDHYHFIFVPTTYDNFKGGFHIFIYCNKEFDKDELITMYDNVRKDYEESFKIYYDYIDENSYDVIFDKGPIVSQQCLIPFAQKRGGRVYTMIDSSFDTDKPQDYFIYGSKMSDSVEIKDEVIDDFKYDDIDDETLKELLNTSTKNELPESFNIIYKLIESLIYLNSSNGLWRILQNHNDRLTKFLRPLIRFTFCNIFIEKSGNIKDFKWETYVNMLTKLMQTMLSATPGESVDYKKIWSYVNSYVRKYSSLNNFTISLPDKNKINDYNEDYENFLSDKVDEYDNYWMYYCKLPEKEKKKYDVVNDQRRKRYIKLFSSCYKGFTDFIVNVVCNSITFDIIPFKIINSKRSDVNSIYDLNENERIKYDSIISNWILLFNICFIFRSGNFDDAIRNTITRLIDRFIWISTMTNGSKEVLVYNFRQNQDLRYYPYNQWIIDRNYKDEAGFIHKWIIDIYNRYIYEPLQNDDNIIGVFIDIIKTFKNNHISMNTLKIRSDYTKCVKCVSDNIFTSTLNSKKKAPVEILNVSEPYFPCRNGILEFQQSGKLVFHEHNFSRFIDGYTNVFYRHPDKYDKSNHYYQVVKKAIDEIYPIKEERDYMLSITSSVLYGCGQKDLFVQLLGNGANGKTVYCSLISNMLGVDKGSSTCTIMETNENLENKTERINISNPKGLCGNMKTDTVLGSLSRMGHDAGGVINVKGKRFCTLQEPNTKNSNSQLNCSLIKELLSGGGQISARGIYQDDESFPVNCLFILQTNNQLGYDEYNEGVRRRMCVIHQRAKFSSTIEHKRYKDQLRFAFEADTSLCSRFEKEAEYHEAIFQLLLPYAIANLTRSGSKSLSAIPRPQSIIDSTNNSFINNTGLGGWLTNHLTITHNNDDYVSVLSLTNKIIEEERGKRNNKTSYDGLLDSTSVIEWKKQIYINLNTNYCGYIWKLRDEYIDFTSRPYKIRRDINPDDLELHKGEHIVGKYFDEVNKALNDIGYSSCPDKSDLFLLGIKLNNDD